MNINQCIADKVKTHIDEEANTKIRLEEIKTNQWIYLKIKSDIDDDLNIKRK